MIYSQPAKTKYLRDIFYFAPADTGRDHIPAFRIAVSVAVPLLVLTLTGHIPYTIYTAFGAFTALYGRALPIRERVREQAIAGLMITASVGVGITLAACAAPAWVVITVSSFTSAICAHIGSILRVRISGPLFYIFASAAIGSLPYNGQPVLSLGLTTASALFCVLTGIILGELMREGQAGTVPPLRWRGHRHALFKTLSYWVPTLASGLIGLGVGISHSYWAMIAASAIMLAPTAAEKLKKAVQRTLGTFLGVLIVAFFISMQPSPWHVAVLVVVAQFLTEMYLKRNYGFSTLFITQIALYVVYLAHPFTTYELLTTRMIDTLVGVAAGVVVILLTPSEEYLDRNTVAIPIVRAARTWRR